MGRRGELDSVGVDGRVFGRQTKPVRAGVNPLASGRSPDDAPMVGDGTVWKSSCCNQGDPPGQVVFMAKWSEEPPGGSQSVRSSEEAGNDRGAKGRRKVNA